MVFQGSLPHMLSTVAQGMLHMNEIIVCKVNETMKQFDLLFLFSSNYISPLFIFSSVTVFPEWELIQSFPQLYMREHTRTHLCTRNQHVTLSFGPIFHSVDFLLL